MIGSTYGERGPVMCPDRRSLGAGLVEYDIDRDLEKKAEMKKKNGGSTFVPVLDIDGTIIRGYDPPAIKAAVERSAAR